MSNIKYWPKLYIVSSPLKVSPDLEKGYFAIFTSRRVFITESYYVLVSANIFERKKDTKDNLWASFTDLRIDELVEQLRFFSGVKIHVPINMWFMDEATAKDILPEFSKPTVPFVVGERLSDELLLAITPPYHRP